MHSEISRAVALLKAGELVAFPTETVYGLGADARNPVAVAKIFAAKGRPADHPLIVHLPDITHLDDWASETPAEAIKLAQAFWPGPLTLILKKQPQVPDIITGGQNTVGLRIPGHPLALELLHAFNGGIAGPSANRFGRISPTTAEHVRTELGNAVPLVLDGGACPVGIESTILDLSRGVATILRPGAITAADIARVIGASMQTSPAVGIAPRVSGSLEAHYAPRTLLRVVETATLLAVEARAALTTGKRIAVLSLSPQPFIDTRLHWHTAPSDAAAYAHAFYATLRTLDEAGYDLILIDALPESQEWLAIVDRLRRAACGSNYA